MFTPLHKFVMTFLALTSLAFSAQDIVPNGTVLSHDLVTTDATKATSFYTSLFNWTSIKKGNNIELQKDSKHIATIIEVTTNKHPQWLPLFSHNNLNLAKENILKNGGKIIKNVEQTKGIGNYLLVRDNDGALSLLTHSSSHEVSQEFPQMQEWLWDEIWSHKVQDSKNFYTHLFGYEVDELPTGYIVLKQNDKWIAGLLNNPFEKSHTQWVSTIRVLDPRATSLKAVSLGGKILVSVDENKEHRDAALIKDPTGAVFIVEKFEQKEQK